MKFVKHFMLGVRTSEQFGLASCDWNFRRRRLYLLS